MMPARHKAAPSMFVKSSSYGTLRRRKTPQGTAGDSRSSPRFLRELRGRLQPVDSHIFSQRRLGPCPPYDRDSDHVNALGHNTPASSVSSGSWGASPQRRSSVRSPLVLPDIPEKISLEDWSVKVCYIEDIVYPSHRNKSYQTSSCLSGITGNSLQSSDTNTSLRLSSFGESSSNTAPSIEIQSPPKNGKIADGAVAKQGAKNARFFCKRNDNTDVTVFVRGTLFACHKAVLAQHSEYFDNVIRAYPGITKMELQGVSQDAFRDLLDYMYSGKLRITCQNVGKLYVTASILKIHKVKKKCARILKKSPYDPKHAIYVYVTARKYGLEIASKRALRLLHHRLEETITCQPFLDLDVHQVCQVLSGNSVGARGEMVIFLAALRWLNHNYLAYESYVLQVLRCVRFTAMSIDELLSCLHPPILPGIMEMHDVRAHIQKALCYKVAMAYNQDHLFADIVSRPRYFLLDGPIQLWDLGIFNPTQALDGLGASEPRCLKLVNSSPERSARKVFPNALQISAAHQRLGQGTPTSEPLDPLADYLLPHLDGAPNWSDDLYKDVPAVKGSVSDDESPVLLAVGGFDPSRPNEIPVGTKIFRYHIKRDSWELYDSFPMSRHHHSVLLHEDKLYITGGFDGYETARGSLTPTAMCFVFDLTLRGWKPIGSMAHARAYHCAAVLGDTIYVVGGKTTNGRPLSTLEKYSIVSGKQWQVLSVKLCRPRMAAAAAAYRELLWIVGGLVDCGEALAVIPDIDCFDPRTNELSFHVSSLPSARCFLSTVVIDDQLFVLGGCCSATDEGSDMASVADVFVHSRDSSWVRTGTLIQPRHDFAAVSVGRSVFVVGGLSSTNRAAYNDVTCYKAVASSVTQQSCRKPLFTALCGTALVALPPALSERSLVVGTAHKDPPF